MFGSFSVQSTLILISWNIPQVQVVESQGVTLITGLQFLYLGEAEDNEDTDYQEEEMPRSSDGPPYAPEWDVFNGMIWRN